MITLHHSSNDQPFLIAVEHVVMVNGDDLGSTITTVTGQRVAVAESFSAVKSLLEQQA